MIGDDKMKVTSEHLELMYEQTYLMGGSTIHMVDIAPLDKREGYMVGGKNIMVLENIDIDEFYPALYEIEGYNVETDYIGTWYEWEEDKYYVDESTWVEDLQDALELGRKNKQVAIWDCEARRAIQC